MSRFYTSKEVREHAFHDDAYVSLNGKVLDLTPLIAAYKARPKFAHLTKPLVQVAGTDISHWWDADADDLRTCVDVNSGMRTYAMPLGRVPHMPTIYPDSYIDLSYDVPWWKDPQYVIGALTSRTRRIRIVNTLTGDETTLEVCAEETLQELLQERYLPINAHARSYTWMRLDPDPRELDMTRTLEDNKINDEADAFEDLGLNADYYIPAIHLYYNDDLTEA
ncbi:Cytochrome b5-like Heme/Steroid binding domain containing protein [Novymonas esmeraldas]|uniref:Cytochrome b5 domain-containing protein 1 n=1 Tax=Novymonas esmeraldas TaxID=1808958 RepID=A0AAW0ELE8_9TRYP